MSLVHDIIKMHLIREGYLPNYPYHLISDTEMCDAFLSSDGLSGYFVDTYTCPTTALQEAYNNLVQSITYYLNKLRARAPREYVLPDWVYSYMLGAVIYKHSSEEDRHDLFVLLGTDNLYDEYDGKCAAAIYRCSQSWLNKLPNASRYVQLSDGTKLDLRPPTMFGESHVIKSLRVAAAMT